MPNITPFLWFDNQAEEAAHYYVSIFKNSKVTGVNRANGQVVTVAFDLNGQPFVALNGGPKFHFTEAVSFVVNCDSQQEIDEYWDKLSSGGAESRCGWLKDRYGLSWQVVPTVLPKLMGGPDPDRTKAVFEAIMKMDKLIIADLQKAYDSAAHV